MTAEARSNDTLPVDHSGEEHIPNIVSCLVCREKGSPSTADITLHHSKGHYIELRGTLECVGDRHRWPIRMREDQLLAADVEFPVTESARLCGVPPGVTEDVAEAESAHFAGLYKASVVISRRALQLALEERLLAEKQIDVSKKTLGPILDIARDKGLLDTVYYTWSQRVLSEGNTGAHKTAVLHPKTVEVVIHDTVEVLNYLYRLQPTSQSGTGSSEV